MFDIFKKKSSEKKGCENNCGEKKLSESEIEQLKQELKEKKEEVRSLYNKLVEAGGTELPDDILEAVAGGILIDPTVIDEHDFVTEVYQSDTWRV
ncbi:MAG: hypothetical protein J5720_01275 [Bacteroidaceae bacterium]|nr:hypothetical protein [Bacteroidaceae bacterium]